MTKKKLLQMLCLTVFFISSPVLYAQQTQSSITFIDIIPWVLAFLALLFSVFQYLRRKKDEISKLEAEMKFKEQKKYLETMAEELKKRRITELEAEKEFKDEEKISAARTAEDIYRAALKEELGTIAMLGSPDIDSKTVKLEDVFVSLCISESWRSEDRYAQNIEMMHHEMERERHLTPAEVMRRAFQNYRLLLVIGDPGSGKTTLLKYYAISCLHRKYRQFGFEDDVFPIYFPLRELEFDKDGKPQSLPGNLSKRSERHLLNISAEQFRTWLNERKTLVLLDGLDEISSKEQRRKVCRWIKDMCTGLGNACFVVTSRATGYRKLDGIELEFLHLRADIMDFSPQQQEDFLKKWFRAVFLDKLPPEDIEASEWNRQQKRRADQQSKTIIDFLKKEDNKAVRDLAAVPMLLQIMAIIRKNRKYLPGTRLALYDAALNYLLAYRDEEKEIEPLLPVEQSRRVLAPTALWMQEELKREEAPKEAAHRKMQPILNQLQKQYDAGTFCAFIRDRAGVIADNDKDQYIFRHKSFREFLSALQLVKESHREDRIRALVESFTDDWWEECLRFFMSMVDADIFDRFMRALFKSKVSLELNAHQQTLLQNLVKEAPERKIDALVEALNSDSLKDNQKYYVMDCLKTIDTPGTVEALEAFIEKGKDEKNTLDRAMDIVAESNVIEREIVTGYLHQAKLSDTFRSPFEGNVEYIKIPGGTYRFSVSKEMAAVPDLYFCKYPVTNKRYRRFIAYLQGEEQELDKMLPLKVFAQKLLEFSHSIEEYSQYLGKNADEWPGKLRSDWHGDKRFNGDDQPVVGVTWYASRAYCSWLSCLDAALTGNGVGDVNSLAGVYRLPTEVEWEWAAGGNPDGSIRPFPWPADKGEPNPDLANYNENVGTTTPVGRYPEGATPLGLVDMAGNVWEWMENLYDEGSYRRALRGGSWRSKKGSLVCSARVNNSPRVLWNVSLGFRVLRASPPVI